MMSYEEYQRIWNDYCEKETIQTPVGLMVGKPTPPGSKIPFSDYMITLEDGPFKGETLKITGLGGGHGTLFLNTEKGKTAVKIEYDQPKVEYDDEDPEECPCMEEDDEDECKPMDPEHEAIRLPVNIDGFRVAKEYAIRAAEWFNGGHPSTLSMPISTMKNGKVVDTEMIPLTLQEKDVWRSLEFGIRNMLIHDYRSTVALSYDTEKKNGGYHSVEMTDVLTVEYNGRKLVITGHNGESELKILEMEVIDKPEVKGTHAPKWYLEEMTRTIEEIRPDGSAQAKILGNKLNWLHPIVLQTPKRVIRQFCLEEFA